MTGHAESAALLLDEAPDRERPGGLQAAQAQLVHGEQRRDDAQRTVEGTAAGHRVEVRPGDDRVGAGRAPPRPQIAVAVVLDGEAPALGLLDEPLPQLHLRVVECVPREPAQQRVSADAGQLGPRGGESAAVGRGPPHLHDAAPGAPAASPGSSPMGIASPAASAARAASG